MSIDPSGEYFIPGQFSKRLEDEHLERYRFASRFVVGAKVLDVACGVGYGTRLLADAGALHATGVDIGDRVIQYANSNFAAENVAYVVGDVTTFGSDSEYDVVVSFETIEHVHDYVSALRNLRRVLKPEGKLIISTPNRPMSWRPAKSLSDQPRNPYHVREFEVSEFLKALRDEEFGFTVSDVYGQRQYRYIANRYLKKAYSLLFHPDDTSSAKVQPLDVSGGKRPKYVVVVASR